MRWMACGHEGCRERPILVVSVHAVCKLCVSRRWLFGLKMPRNEASLRSDSCNASAIAWGGGGHGGTFGVWA
jgi:hypothetical protein